MATVGEGIEDSPGGFDATQYGFFASAGSFQEEELGGLEEEEGGGGGERGLEEGEGDEEEEEEILLERARAEQEPDEEVYIPPGDHAGFSGEEGGPRVWEQGQERGRHDDTGAKGVAQWQQFPPKPAWEQTGRSQEQAHLGKGREGTDKQHKRIAGQWMSAEEVGRLLKIQHAATHPAETTPYQFDYYALAIGKGAGAQVPFRPPPGGSGFGGGPQERRFAPLAGLGRVPLNNLNKPKPVVDIDSSQGEGSASELAQEPGVAARLLVEQAEANILAADDVQRQLGDPQPGDPPVPELQRRRDSLLRDASNLLNPPHEPAPEDPGADAVASHVLSLAKGRAMAGRLLIRPVPPDSLGPLCWCVARQAERAVPGGALWPSLARALSSQAALANPAVPIGTAVALAKCKSIETLPAIPAAAALSAGAGLMRRGALQGTAVNALTEAAQCFLELALKGSPSACSPDLAQALSLLLDHHSLLRLYAHLGYESSSAL